MAPHRGDQRGWDTECNGAKLMTRGTEPESAVQTSVIGTTAAPSRPADPGNNGNLEARRRRWPIAVCVGLYVLLAVVAFGSSNTLGSGHMAGPGSIDQIIDVWWLAWAQFALAHGHNLFFSNWQNYPDGLNAVVNTSMLGLGVLISPITSAFGPIVAWNVLERAALVLSATTMCLVLRRWTDWWPAAFVGGMLYGFSVYETTSSPHLNVAFVALPPLFFLLLHELFVRQQWRPARVGALLGVICGVQYLISSEILASMVLFGAIAAVLYLLTQRRKLASSWTYVRRALPFALVVGGALLAGPVLFTAFGPQHVNGVPNSPANLALLHGDLLGPFVPGSFQRFSLHGLVAFYQLNSEAMYLGIPFILGVGVVTVLLWRRAIVATAGTLAGVSFVLSLGSTLYVDGHDTHIPLPFTVLAHVPIVDGLLSTRLALYTVLFGAAVVAIGIDALHKRVARSSLLRASSWQLRRAVAAGASFAVAAVVAVPMLPAHAQSATPSRVSTFFSSPVAVNDIPHGSAVLAYPYPDVPVFPGNSLGFSFSSQYQAVNDALLDQAASGFPFKLIGGYGWSPDGASDSIGPSMLQPESVKDLFDFAFYGVTTQAGQAANLSTNHLDTDIRSFLRAYNVGTVVVLPVGQHPATVTSALDAAIGAPFRQEGAAVWFDVQHRLRTVSPTKGYRVTGPPPVTRIVKPVTGVQIGGRQYLDAVASDAFGVSSVDFELSGENSARTVVCRAAVFQFGWLCGWNTATVPNGRYTLQSVATDAVGQVTQSPGVIVHVHN
jgi:hypothetical protein